MKFTPAYKPGGNIILLVLVLVLLHIFFLPQTVSDEPTMSALLASVTPTPLGWSSATHFCKWRGVTCDSKNKVISLDLASHSLSGTLPPSLNSLTFLTNLSLQHNHFSGQIPSFANLSCLRYLYLHNNSFSFSAIQPRTFSGLTALRTLSLSNNNHLSPWPFPSELASSSQLTALYASNTNMMGSMPPDIFYSFPRLVNLSLSLNNLTGSLPASFNGSSIQNLKLDNQKVGLTGTIDPLTGMNNLSVLWLHGNLFTGAIPTSFASLSNLVSVRLDNNKFTNPIPHFPVVANEFFTNETLSSNCRRCKVFIRVAVSPPPPSYPPPKPSSGEKPNVGAVVGYTILLVLVLVGFAFCVWCHDRTYCPRCTTLQGKAVEQPEIPMVVQKPQEQIVRVERDVDGEEQPRKEEILGQQPGQLNDVKKKPENMEGLGQQLIQVKDVKKKHKKVGGLGQQPVQGKDVKKNPEKIEGLGRLGKNEVPVMPNDIDDKAGKQLQEVVEEQGFSLKKFPYYYVRIITNNFDSENVIGKGGFGQVYKGKLVNNGTPIAVKRLNKKHSKIDDFKNEVEVLGRTSHFNLVKLIGYCAEDEHRMLVYELMSNGSLEDWIFGTNSEKTLSWLEKKRIILVIAEGLVYLHENCEKKIVHRDLKPSNVLLDDKKNAKLCDFGISKLLERDQSSTSTLGWGTRGYAAPEIGKGRKISEKVDVYSFGVVVLEVLFGTRYFCLVSSNQTNFETNQLPGLIRKLDDEMRKNGKEIEMIGKLAVLCLSEEPGARPTMSEIVGAIKGANAKVGKILNYKR